MLFIHKACICPSNIWKKKKNPESERKEQPEREASDKAGVETCICNYGALFFLLLVNNRLQNQSCLFLWTTEPLFISSVHKKTPKAQKRVAWFFCFFFNPKPKTFSKHCRCLHLGSEKPVAAAVWLTERLIDYTLLLIKDPAAVLLDVLYKFPASLARQRLQLLYGRVLTGGRQKCFL